MSKGEGGEATKPEELTPKDRMDKVLASLRETKTRTDRIAQEPHPFPQEDCPQPPKK